MNRTGQIPDFNPSGVGLKNGNFIGLPFSGKTANVILIPVPWDVTVSSGKGTANGPQAILNASVQLDLFDSDVPEAWKLGIYMMPVNQDILDKSKKFSRMASDYINFVEHGGKVTENLSMRKKMEEVNAQSNELNNWVYEQSNKILESGKLAGVIGGDHSVPLGLLNALAEKYDDFGILQIDAHFDLRHSYEDFTWSHASIFYNVLKIKSVSKLVQVGIRDYCEEEIEKVKTEGDRISVFFDQQLKENSFTGMQWNQQCEKIIDQLPSNVYVSFDIDGLDPGLCPRTGTPVPGGLDFPETVFLLKKVVETGRKIIGFDVCETGNSNWDGNVAARVIYKLCNLAGKSQKLV